MRKIREGNVSKKQIVENKGIDLSNRFENIKKQKQYEIDRIKKEKEYREERQWKREEDKIDRKTNRKEDTKDYVSKVLRLALTVIFFLLLVYLLRVCLPGVYSWIIEEFIADTSFYGIPYDILIH